MPCGAAPGFIAARRLVGWDGLASPIGSPRKRRRALASAVSFAVATSSLQISERVKRRRSDVTVMILLRIELQRRITSMKKCQYHQVFAGMHARRLMAFHG
jgi:hypothetical protein